MGGAGRRARWSVVTAAIVVGACACGAFGSDDDPAPVASAPDAGEPDVATGDDAGGGDAAGCGDTTSNASSCGACGHDCMGGACVAGKCQPEALADLGGAPGRVALAGATLYATVRAGGTSHVYRVAAAPGATPELVDPGSFVGATANGDLDADEGGAFWGTPNGLRRAAPDGGAEDFGDGGASVHGVRLAGARVLWTEYSAYAAPVYGKIASCDKAGCASPQLTRVDYPWDVVEVGGKRVWLGLASGGSSLELRDGAGSIVQGQQLPSRMVTDGANLVAWSAVDALRVLDVGARSVTDVVAPTTAPTRVNGLAVGAGGALYFGQGDAVKRCPLAAAPCTPEIVATLAGRTVVEVAVDDSFVYAATDAGAVFRVRLP